MQMVSLDPLGPYLRLKEGVLCWLLFPLLYFVRAGHVSNMDALEAPLAPPSPSPSAKGSKRKEVRKQPATFVPEGSGGGEFVLRLQ